MSEITVTGFCYPPCAERVAAEAAWAFGWSEVREAWCVPEGATRTPKGRYYAVDVCFADCPYCGRELILADPLDDADVARSFVAQATEKGVKLKLEDGKVVWIVAPDLIEADSVRYFLMRYLSDVAKVLSEAAA